VNHGIEGEGLCHEEEGRKKGGRFVLEFNLEEL
jgi:hypothetical protein